jgi:hypothetical protein
MNRAILRAVVILVVVVGAGVMLGMLASRGPHPRKPSVPEEVAPTVAENPATNAVRRVPFAPPVATRPRGTNSVSNHLIAVELGTNTPPDLAVTNLITDWEDRLDTVLGGDEDDKVKSQKLLEIFPNLPPDGKEEIMRHLSNLVEDGDYAQLGKYLVDVSQPEAVLDVLIQDVLNRPNATKLPLLLEVAQQPDHPKSSEAKDLLELFLEEDYGSDWAKWKSKMENWLKENPD